MIPAERLCTRCWRLRNSTWMLPALLLLGLATWASFLYVGIKGKRRDWLIWAALYGAAVGVAIIVLRPPFSGTPTRARTSPGSTAVGGVISAV